MQVKLRTKGSESPDVNVKKLHKTEESLTSLAEKKTQKEESPSLGLKAVKQKKEI